MNTDEDPKLIPKGVIYIKYGETVELECKDEHMFKNFSVARCTDGRLTVSRCKYLYKLISVCANYPQDLSAATDYHNFQLKPQSFNKH